GSRVAWGSLFVLGAGCGGGSPARPFLGRTVGIPGPTRSGRSTAGRVIAPPLHRRHSRWAWGPSLELWAGAAAEDSAPSMRKVILHESRSAGAAARDHSPLDMGSIAQKEKPQRKNDGALRARSAQQSFSVSSVSLW